MSAGAPPDSWWDRASAHYDRQLWLERSAVRSALELLAAQPGERLLDVGTGTGEVLRQLAKRTGHPREATGFDTSARMLARVPALPPGWTARQADVRRLPFDDRSFDVAVASYVLQVLPPSDQPLALAEIHRVLRPGGRLVTVTPAIPQRGVARAVALASDALARRGPHRYGGLAALDPREALGEAGFLLLRARFSLRGYPSLVVLARSADHS